MRAFRPSMNALAKTALGLARNTADIAPVSSCSCILLRNFSDKPSSGDGERRPPHGRGRGATNQFIKDAKQRVFEDRVQLSRVSAIMSASGPAPKKKPAEPVQPKVEEGQFESVEEDFETGATPKGRKTRKQPKHSRGNAYMRHGEDHDEHDHPAKRRASRVDDYSSEVSGRSPKAIAPVESELSDAEDIDETGEKRAAARVLSAQVLDDMDMKTQEGEYEISVDALTTDGDKFLAELFNETTRSATGEIMEYYEDEQALKRERSKIKEPRTAMQLLYALQPNVRTAREGTPAYEIASTAHQVLMRSPYYTEAERTSMVDQCGTLLSTKAPAWATELVDEVVLKRGFRPGMKAASQLGQQKEEVAEWYGDQAAPARKPAGKPTVFADEEAFDEDDLERQKRKK